MRDFFAMGGYALWVWSAYSMAVVVLVANAVAARSRFRQCLQRMRRQSDAQAGRVEP